MDRHETLTGLQVASGGGATNHLHLHFWGDLSEKQLSTAKTIIAMFSNDIILTPSKFERIRKILDE